MKKITLGIDGMMCGMCESHVADTIRNNFPVRKVKADRSKKEAVIIADTDISEKVLHDAIDPTGYTVTSYQIEDYQKRGLFGF